MLPSTVSVTPATPTESEALTETVVAPESALASVGDVIETLGEIVSPAGVASVSE